MSDAGEPRQNADDSVHQQGDGPKIVIVQKMDELKPYAYAFLIVIVFNVLLSGAALIMCLVGAPALLSKSEYMSEKLAENTRYEVQMFYWANMVYAEAHAKGLKIPPPPKPKE